jgi:hypothetical protein
VLARVSVTRVGTMSSRRMISLSSDSIMEEHFRDTRARAWAYVFDCHCKKEATRPGSPDDAKEIKNGSRQQQYTG